MLTIVQTAISRTVIDVNRDPSRRLALSRPGDDRALPEHDVRRRAALSEWRGAGRGRKSNVARRAGSCLITTALSAELERLRGVHDQVVLYDCHSIRSSVPRLFEGILPHFNIGTNGGASCAPELTAAVEAACDATSFSRVTNGRFRGGYITRHHGKPQAGVHAIQMELACRSYLPEPIGRVDQTNWPPPFDQRACRTDRSPRSARFCERAFSFAATILGGLTR